MTKRITVPVGGPYPSIPQSVAACPICGAGIHITDIDEWYDDGTTESVHINCTTEPDINGDSGKWYEWQRGHWSTPYIDWLPVEKRVTDWFNACYRVEVAP
jgi:hypothetical protein